MEHDFDIRHVEGKLNPADAPSRAPLQSTADSTGARMAHDWDPVKPPVPTILMMDGSQLIELPSQEELAAELGINNQGSESGSDPKATGGTTYTSALGCFGWGGQAVSAWSSDSKAAAAMLASAQYQLTAGCNFVTAENVLGRDVVYTLSGRSIVRICPTFGRSKLLQWAKI